MREIQVKMRYHFTLVKMAVTKKSKVYGYREKGILEHCWWECK
jgi:hypothetical protein